MCLHDFYAKKGLCNPTLPLAKVSVCNNSYLKFNTFVNPLFNDLHELFYVKQGNKYVKQLDSALGQFLTLKSMAAWLADDGTLRGGNTAFCTDSFSDDSLNLLIQAVKEKFNVQLVKYTHVKRYTRLHVASKDMPLFIDLMAEHVHPSMLYKLGAIEAHFGA
jgi:hypothetical protein